MGLGRKIRKAVKGAAKGAVRGVGKAASAVSGTVEKTPAGKLLGKTPLGKLSGKMRGAIGSDDSEHKAQLRSHYSTAKQRGALRRGM